jgi:hypothetical protein
MGMSATVFHIPFIQALPQYFTLHSIMERSATPTKSAARERYGNHIKVVNTLDEVLNDADVECVVIGTPNTTHFEYAKVWMRSLLPYARTERYRDLLGRPNRQKARHNRETSSPHISRSDHPNLPRLLPHPSSPNSNLSKPSIRL